MNLRSMPGSPILCGQPCKVLRHRRRAILRLVTLINRLTCRFRCIQAATASAAASRAAASAASLASAAALLRCGGVPPRDGDDVFDTTSSVATRLEDARAAEAASRGAGLGRRAPAGGAGDSAALPRRATAAAAEGLETRPDGVPAAVLRCNFAAAEAAALVAAGSPPADAVLLRRRSASRPAGWLAARRSVVAGGRNAPLLIELLSLASVPAPLYTPWYRDGDTVRKASAASASAGQRAARALAPPPLAGRIDTGCDASCCAAVSCCRLSTSSSMRCGPSDARLAIEADRAAVNDDADADGAAAATASAGAYGEALEDADSEERAAADSSATAAAMAPPGPLLARSSDFGDGSFSSSDASRPAVNGGGAMRVVPFHDWRNGCCCPCLDAAAAQRAMAAAAPADRAREGTLLANAPPTDAGVALRVLAAVLLPEPGALPRPAGSFRPLLRAKAPSSRRCETSPSEAMARDQKPLSAAQSAAKQMLSGMPCSVATGCSASSTDASRSCAAYQWRRESAAHNSKQFRCSSMLAGRSVLSHVLQST